MKAAIVARVVTDTELSPDACRIVLYVAGLGDGAHEIRRTKLSALLNHPGDKRVRAAIQLAIDVGYLVRSAGGRGHADSYEFRVPPEATLNENRVAPEGTLSDRVAPQGTLNADRVAPGGTLNGASSPTTTSSSPPPSDAREESRVDSIDEARLREHLGEHGRAVDLMLASAKHPASWASAIWGKYGPSGTQLHVYSGIPPDRHPAVLATAMLEYATKGEVFDNRHFDGFMRKAAKDERGRDAGGAGGEAAGKTRGATGTDGRRRQFRYE